ncbi:MAG: hypothetical protein KGJ23_08660 [Euryarchaeota archaeon]|nr:hypothetical protein [Euryarchaeota archaeon]MDE1836674.1 hypothetical protein [Euryarchaeota archaeon]MDE1880297.1 hypothetical protein [Euryarchaeota archaeon]MDE2044644.1 hypothetical protein [Thermoplasmata archaeon]
MGESEPPQTDHSVCEERIRNLARLLNQGEFVPGGIHCLAGDCTDDAVFIFCDAHLKEWDRKYREGFESTYAQAATRLARENGELEKEVARLKEQVARLQQTKLGGT